jgi:hypothetical protein
MYGPPSTEDARICRKSRDETGKPARIGSLRSQTGDPVCQLVAVILSKIRDCDHRLGTAPQFAANMAALPACRAGGRATEQAPGRVHS